MAKGTQSIILPQWDGVFRKQEVEIPASKSLANRALVIQALQPGISLSNMSTADDSQVLQHIIKNKPSVSDVGPAGTPFRFLTSLVAATPGWETELTGSPRMLERPIGPLVDALLDLGADITYTGKIGYPPLIIKGKKLKGGKIELNSQISSQYISSLMLIAPSLESGLEVRFNGKPVSEDYIRMTAGMMEYFGAQVQLESTGLTVENQDYHPRNYTVESDWSGVSYFYGLVALAEEGQELRFPFFSRKSLQGDAVLQTLFTQYGVETRWEDAMLVIKKVAKHAEHLGVVNCNNFPDLAQTLVVASSLLQQSARFEGLETLRIKETDRIAACKNELGKMHYPLETGPDWFATSGQAQSLVHNSAIFETYHDHRMAMALAMCCRFLDQTEIENREVVSKSFPHFWEELETALF